MSADLSVTQPSARVNGWRRLWIVATVFWWLVIIIQFGIYLTKASAYSSEPSDQAVTSKVEQSQVPCKYTNVVNHIGGRKSWEAFFSR